MNKQKAVIGLMLMAGGAGQALGQTQAQPQDLPNPTPYSIDQLNMAGPNPAKSAAPAVAAEKNPFIDDAKFGAQLRSFYFNRDKYDNTHSEAWALGGSVSLKTGYLADIVRFGAVAYTSQPLYAPNDRDGTLLLKPGQDSYTVLGQWYAEVKFTDRIFGAIGAKEYSTPFINNHDVRMTINTFEGATVYGTAGGQDGAPAWRFGGGYITKIKEKNSDKFVWMSRDAGANVDRGVYLAGVNYAQGAFSLGAIGYHSDDVINIYYTEAKYTMPAGAYKLGLAAQYANQNSAGTRLLTGNTFSTHQWGAKADLIMESAVLTLAYTDVANNANMQNPWGGYPGYASLQVQDFNRAAESTVMLKGAYDFSRHGAQGLSAYALVAHGSGRKAPSFNETEYDFNLQWTPKDGALKGSSWRARYARVDQRGGGDPRIDDFRLIVNYDF